MKTANHINHFIFPIILEILNYFELYLIPDRKKTYEDAEYALNMC